MIYLSHIRRFVKITRKSIHDPNLALSKTYQLVLDIKLSHKFFYRFKTIKRVKFYEVIPEITPFSFKAPTYTSVLTIYEIQEHLSLHYWYSLD